MTKGLKGSAGSDHAGPCEKTGGKFYHTMGGDKAGGKYNKKASTAPGQGNNNHDIYMPSVGSSSAKASRGY